VATSVVVLGKGTLAIRVAEWFERSPDHALRWIVPVVPEPSWTASLTAWAQARGVRRVASGDYRDLPDSGQIADLGVSVFYDRLIGADAISRFGRLINLHNGPLPRYRGVSPINWALKNGERMHGVTIHEIAPGIDDGPIVAQVEYSIYPEVDEVRDVYERALAYGWTLFEQTMPLLEQIRARAQDEVLASYHSTADDERLGERRDFTRELSRQS
jgi:methionyl-tRNA formyltransferase